MQRLYVSGVLWTKQILLACARVFDTVARIVVLTADMKQLSSQRDHYARHATASTTTPIRRGIILVYSISTFSGSAFVWVIEISNRISETNSRSAFLHDRASLRLSSHSI